MTPYMSLRPHMQNYLRMVSIYVITTAPSLLALALKKRLRRLRNGAPEGTVSAILLFNIYTKTL